MAQNVTKEETFTWDTLLAQAAKEKYGRRARVVYDARCTTVDKEWFIKQLCTDAKNIKPRKPAEISRDLVWIDNERGYSNSTDFETTYKVSLDVVENSEDHVYHESTKKGVQWGTNTNIGLQFGLPQATSNHGTMMESSSQVEGIQLEERSDGITIKLPAWKRVVVNEMTYRVHFKLDYTLECKISKLANIRIQYNPCGMGLYMQMGNVTASELLEPLPSYREDKEFVYFTQEGELMWTEKRMKVKLITVDDAKTPLKFNI